MFFNQVQKVLLVAATSLLLMQGCATSAQKSAGMRQSLLQGRPDLALINAEQGGDSSDVMVNMNRGMLRRMNRDYTGSNEALESAKKKIEELYAVSVSESVGSVMVNDETISFEGDRFEQVLVHAYKALNYISLGQIDSARASLAGIEALEEEARNAEDLEELLSREDVQKLLGRHSTRAGAVPSKTIAEKSSLPNVYRNMPRKLHPRRYQSAEGMEIWVGRSDEANDYLTTRFARGKDLFFHLDGAPGSHVILRTEGRDDPPPEAVLDACELAVHFSKQKNAGRADVHVVPIKNVKKPKGAKRGLVYVTGGKSIHLRREPARLERLLAAKIDD